MLRLALLAVVVLGVLLVGRASTMLYSGRAHRLERIEAQGPAVPCRTGGRRGTGRTEAVTRRGTRAPMLESQQFTTRRPMSSYPHPIIAREGWPFIAIGVVVALALHAVGWHAVAALAWIFVVFCVQFFRDPATRRAHAGRTRCCRRPMAAS